jgi:hypothetical protein
VRSHPPARLHASGPCQNHLGLVLIAGAIIRFTSPETASLVAGAARRAGYTMSLDEAEAWATEER